MCVFKSKLRFLKAQLSYLYICSMIRSRSFGVSPCQALPPSGASPLQNHQRGEDRGHSTSWIKALSPRRNNCPHESCKLITHRTPRGLGSKMITSQSLLVSIRFYTLNLKNQRTCCWNTDKSQLRRVKPRGQQLSQQERGEGGGHVTYRVKGVRVEDRKNIPGFTTP